MNCKFKTAKYSAVNCSNDEIQIESLSIDDRDIVLSEISLIYGRVTREYVICSAHVSNILERNRLNSLRLYKCGIPSNIAAHKGWPRGHRKLTKDGMVRIHSSTGLVLPIGIPICTLCRKCLTLESDGATSHSSLAEDFIKTAEVSSTWQGEELCGMDENDPVINEDTFGIDSSQSLSFSQDSEAPPSQDSEASACLLGKRDQLNSFLNMSNISPVKEKQVPLKTSSEKTKKKCVSKALQCLSAICNTICPGDGEALKDIVFKSLSNNYAAEDCITDPTSNILKEIYNGAESWTLQRQILSIITRERSYTDVKKIITDVTPWKYYKAKSHTHDVGCGLPITKEKVSRNKIDNSQLEHFIDYILSTNVVKDLPYGMKTMKLMSGEVVDVPNLIRSLAPSSLVTQYIQYCNVENIKHLGSSTLFKILNDCAASVRKCVEGIDYYVAEGGRAFNDLELNIEKMNVPDEQVKRLKAELLTAKRYIKTDFKVHIQKESSVADHCRLYALSDEETCFSSNCEHQHTDICNQCLQVDNILAEITDIVNESEWENKDAILFEVESAVDSIREWRCHIMRSRNQEDARLDLVKGMDEGQLLVTCDWAMKFLPRKYREGQTDWFAKRGINWHISVTVFKDGNSVKNITHVHLFTSQVSQDARITASVLHDVVTDLNIIFPNHHGIHFFSDNAGCYKNTLMIASLHEQIGEEVKSYNFSEAQDGKGPCDRRSSHIKSCIKRYVNEGHDVTSAEEMKVAIDARQNGTYRVKVVDVVNIVDEEKSQLKPITAITQLNNFSFETAGVRVWRAYGVGEGKLISWRSLGVLPERTELLVKFDWSNALSVVDEGVDDNPKRQRMSVQYDCPKDGCTKSFASHQSLEDHLLLGDCDYYQELSLHDRAKVMYGTKVNSIFLNTNEISVPCEKNSGVSELRKGWALKVKKKRIVFSKEQKDYMQEKFDVGKRTGRKVDPYVAAQDMRYIKHGTRFMFNRSQYLSGQQISSYFSRLALKDRKCDIQDQRSAEEEDIKRELKMDILDNMNR